MSRADAPGQGALTAYRSLSRLQAQPAQPCCLRARNATGHTRAECSGACAQNATGHARAECYGECARRMLRGMRAQNATGMRTQNATGHARRMLHGMRAECYGASARKMLRGMRIECYGACARRMLRSMHAQNATGHARAECYGACARRQQHVDMPTLIGLTSKNAMKKNTCEEKWIWSIHDIDRYQGVR